MNIETKTTKIREFTDLRTWKEARVCVLLIYKNTKKFPNEELFGLVTQIRRASISIISNIAEGFGRWSYKEKLRFYLIAHGFLLEVKSQLFIAKDLEYISPLQFEETYQQLEKTHILLQGLMKSTRQKISD